MDQLVRNKHVVQRAWAAYDAGDEAGFMEQLTGRKAGMGDNQT